MRPKSFPLPRSVATVSLAGTLPEKLEAATSVGFNGVELFEKDLLTFDGKPAEVRRIGPRARSGDHGLSAVPDEYTPGLLPWQC